MDTLEFLMMLIIPAVIIGAYLRWQNMTRRKALIAARAGNKPRQRAVKAPRYRYKAKP